LARLGLVRGLRFLGGALREAFLRCSGYLLDARRKVADLVQELTAVVPDTLGVGAERT
jgi:hypothetical protein